MVDSQPRSRIDQDVQAGPSRHAYPAAARYLYGSPLDRHEDSSSARSSSRVAVTDEVGMISSHPVTAKAFGKQRELKTERANLQEQGLQPRDTPVEFGSRPTNGEGKGKQRDNGEIDSPREVNRERAGFWERSKQRARSDRSSWDYGMPYFMSGDCLASNAAILRAPRSTQERIGRWNCWLRCRFPAINKCRQTLIELTDLYIGKNRNSSSGSCQDSLSDIECGFQKICRQVSIVCLFRLNLSLTPACYIGTPLGLLHAIKVIYGKQGPLGLFQGHSATLLRIFPYAAIKFMAYERLEGVSTAGESKTDST